MSHIKTDCSDCKSNLTLNILLVIKLSPAKKPRVSRKILILVRTRRLYIKVRTCEAILDKYKHLLSSVLTQV